MPGDGPSPSLTQKAQPGLLAWLGFLLLAALYLGLVIPLKLAWLDRGWGGSDLVVLGNALWNTVHGHCVLCSDAFVTDPSRPLSLLNLHFDPSLLLLIPLGGLADPLRALLWTGVLSSLALAAALYAAVLKDAASLLWAWSTAALWLFNPLCLLAVLNRGYGFQVDNLAPLFAAALLQGWSRRSGLLFALGCLGLAGIKEDYAVLLFLGLLGAWYSGIALPVPTRRLLLALLAFGLLAAGVALYRPSSSYVANIPQRFGHGDGWAHLGVWAQLLLLPFWWAQPLAALAALHVGLLVLLGDLAKHYFHYVPSTLLAALALPDGLARFQKRSRGAALLILVLSALATAGLGAGVLVRQALAFSGQPLNDRPRLRAALALSLPRQASICASSDLLACIYQRRHMLPMGRPEGADYILLNHKAAKPVDDELRDWVLAEEKLGRYVRQPDPIPGIALFARASPLAGRVSAFP
jgi:hypothetical protein